MRSFRPSALWLALLLLPAAGSGQSMAVSEAEKISSSFLNYRVLGKNESGILVYKHKRDRELIETYNANMALVRRKTLETGAELSESVTLLLMHDGSLIHFYVVKDRKTQYLRAQILDDKLVDRGQAMAIDSASRRDDGQWDEFYIRHSEDRKRVLVFRQNVRSGETESLSLRVYNPVMEELMSDELVLLGDDRKMILHDGYLSNEGDVAFVQLRDDSKQRSENLPHIAVHIRPGSLGLFRRLDFQERPEWSMREIAFRWDAINKRLVGAGFYAEAGRSFASGVLFLAAESEGLWYARSYTPFSPELVKSLTGNSSRRREEIPFYDIQELIVRSDGGIVLISEFINETSESYEFTDYDPYYGGYRTSTRYINYHEYEDILLLMFNPDGSLGWEDVIRKKQISREDRGRNSSFALLNARRQLFFIFNEDISYNTNVLQYNMDTRGAINRHTMFNANSKELMLVPRRARQVSGNEIIIPSIYKNNLAFVKISY